MRFLTFSIIHVSWQSVTLIYIMRSPKTDTVEDNPVQKDEVVTPVRVPYVNKFRHYHHDAANNDSSTAPVKSAEEVWNVKYGKGEGGGRLGGGHDHGDKDFSIDATIDDDKNGGTNKERPLSLPLGKSNHLLSVLRPISSSNHSASDIADMRPLSGISSIGYNNGYDSNISSMQNPLILMSFSSDTDSVDYALEENYEVGRDVSVDNKV